jgi:hypothetical protein
MRHSTAAFLPFSVRLGGPHPLRFGTGRRWLAEWMTELPQGLSDDARLFAATWAAGFLGFSIFLA